MKVVANASSLIHSAKVPKFWVLLKETFKEVYIPQAVYHEILKGREIQSPDIPLVERAISDGWIKIVEVQAVPKLPNNLGQGEKEAIALTEQLKINWVLIDDRVASTTARLRGLEVRSIAYLLIYLKRKGKINQTQAINLLDDLIKSGYYLSSRDYVNIKEILTLTKSTQQGVGR